ncbi:hypothetical protein [Tunturiibacter gelidoferens]|uniref:Uncharacterized protein n=1 Tax=Tunturiibacter gelidiferens TaxID=3069689 RepID=A0A9X0QJ29_9BACT|nr:hypothetical protein [Edaphobacter lichenicola]MBB5331382.1 hypothetical protein [Edaphobacter lichenicola]
MQGSEGEVSVHYRSLAVLFDEVDRPLVAVHEVHHDSVHDGSLEHANVALWRLAVEIWNTTRDSVSPVNEFWL